jgi:hypothetical protein
MKNKRLEMNYFPPFSLHLNNNHHNNNNNDFGHFLFPASVRLAYNDASLLRLCTDDNLYIFIGRKEGK